jgi:hypothetical protein
VRNITQDTEAIKKFISFLKPKNVYHISFFLETSYEDSYNLYLRYIIDSDTIFTFTTEEQVKWNDIITNDIKNFLGIKVRLISSSRSTKDYWEEQKRDTQNEALKKLSNLII